MVVNGVREMVQQLATLRDVNLQLDQLLESTTPTPTSTPTPTPPTPEPKETPVNDVNLITDVFWGDFYGEYLSTNPSVSFADWIRKRLEADPTDKTLKKFLEFESRIEGVFEGKLSHIYLIPRYDESNSFMDFEKWVLKELHRPPRRATEVKKLAGIVSFFNKRAKKLEGGGYSLFENVRSVF